MDIGVFAFITNQENKILLVQDATREQKWSLPGGGLHESELVSDAIIREVREETGLTAIPIKLLGIFSQRKSPGIVILFEMRIISGELKHDAIETQDCQHFSVTEIEEMQNVMKPAQLSMIRQVLQNQVPANALPIFNFFV